MSVINTNITAMIGQQNLNQSQNDLTTSMERLSSGLRINSAQDDAAGQAIANRMSAQITGLSTAQRNANDGISVAQTAEGALNQVNDNLQRVRELTVQSQNDTNSAKDKASIQAEIDQRLTEIDRISEQTDFNGVKVLSEDQSLSIQVGANDGESIDVKLEEITSKTLKLDSFNVNGPQGAVADAAAADFADAYGTSTGVADSSVTDFADDLATELGVSAAAVTADTGDAKVDEAGNWYAEVSVQAQSDAEVQALNRQGFDFAGTGAGDAQTFQVALDPAEADITTAATTAAFTVEGSELGAKDLLSGATANPMEQMDNALNQVDELRSDLGAVQNRFESAITNLSTNETNLSAARSRIEDADYATEVANMTKNQILQQAGTSILAQANQLPQNVLSLLG
ncbi:FliC/FljB family flagellin [Vreelandella subglaciescola]|uniref:Flagellin n=1 Tax=Vreelandella subglaciescola TaxID=29571 RepID=A0A1M7GVH4_9GAMM|nr:FliC/FljB family flagellin [Halomonas subglaciescola]SHM20281.1 flagellin [Halomonas subglaciescola]